MRAYCQSLMIGAIDKLLNPFFSNLGLDRAGGENTDLYIEVNFLASFLILLEIGDRSD